MTTPPDDEEVNAAPLQSEEETAERKKKKEDEGEGDSDSFGRGKAGAASAVTTTVAKLPPTKLKEVWANFRELKGQDLVDAVVEFFAEGPMRASANAAVSWVKKANAKSFAIVNWALEAGDKAVRDFVRTRDRGAGRDSRGFVQKQSTKPTKYGVIPANPNVPRGS